MDPEREIDRAMQRTRRYYYDDGLAEIAIGCLFGAIGLLFLLEAWLPPGPLAAGLSALGLPLLFIGGGLFLRWAVRVAKERITYPRTGYVAYPRPERRVPRKVTAAVGAGMGAIMAFLLAQAPAALAWLPALQGLLMGGFTLYLGQRLGLVRLYAVAAVCVCIGLAAALARLGDILGSAVFFAGVGLAFIISGGLTLVAYLSQTQPAGE